MVMGRFKRDYIFAFKSVIYNFKNYLWFFIASLIIQTFISTMSLAAFNTPNAVGELAEAGYDYHVILKNVNSDQYLLMENGLPGAYSAGKYYEISDVMQYGATGEFDQRYDVYIRFKGDVSRSYDRFEYYFSDLLRQYNSSGSWYKYVTPLLKSETGIGVDLSYYLIFLICSASVFAIFLGILFTVRANYFKLSYGIFMTFGGGFRKIYSTSFREMAIIDLFTIIPSSVISFIAVRIIYVHSGFAFRADPRAFFASFAVSLVISSLSLYAPCKRISLKTPVENIISSDNSNYVTSPRYSLEFFNVSIPNKYELTSLFRFRKYNIRLVLTGVVFTAMFAWMSQLSALYLQALDVDLPDYTVNFSEPTSPSDEETPDTSGEESGEEKEEEGSEDVIEGNEENPVPDYLYTENIDDEIRLIDGIDCVQRVVYSNGEDISSYIIIDPSFHDSAVSCVKTGSGDALNTVNFAPFSEKEIAYLGRFEYEGDLNKALNGRYAVVSDSIYNESHFKYAPGDSITVGVMTEQIRYVPDRLSGLQLFERQLDAYAYDYHEYEIAAVVKGLPDQNDVSVYLPEQDYKALAGVDDISCRTARIWLKPGVSDSESDYIESRIASVLKPYYNASVTNAHNSAMQSIELSGNKYEIFRITSAVLLAIMLLSWIFSQHMFYFKRFDEFEILESFGLPIVNFRKILALDALILGCASVFTYFVVTPLISRIIRMIANRFFSDGGTVRYSALVGPWILIIGAAALIAASAISSIITYAIYKRRIRSNDKISINTEFEEK